MDPAEARIQRALHLLEEAGKEYATTEEVAEIIGILISIIEEAKPKAITAATDAAMTAIDAKVNSEVHRLEEILTRAITAAGATIEKAALDEARAVFKKLAAEKDVMLNAAIEKVKLKRGTPGKDAVVNYEYIIDQTLASLDLEDGEDGKMPDHQWDGTKLRFEKPDGSWGPWVELRGQQGPGHYSLFGGGSDGGPGGLEKVSVNGIPFREGVTSIDFGANLIVTRTGNGISVRASASGGSGMSVATEKLTGTQASTSVTLDLTTLANVFTGVLMVTRQGQVLTPTTDYSISGNTVTIFNADAAEVFLVQYSY